MDFSKKFFRCNGAKVNSLNKGTDKVFYKFINSQLNHKGKIYGLGENEDIIAFSTDSPCSPGGMYFTDILNIYRFISYGENLCRIQIPDDAECYVEDFKIKADRFIILSIEKFDGRFPEWDIPEFYQRMISPAILNYLTNVSSAEMAESKVFTLFESIDTAIDSPDLCHVIRKLWGDSNDYGIFHDSELLLKVFERDLDVMIYIFEYRMEFKFDIDYDGLVSLIDRKPQYIEWVPFPYRKKELCVAALTHSSGLIEHIPSEFLSHKVLTCALEENPNILPLVKNILANVKFSFMEKNECITAALENSTVLLYAPELPLNTYNQLIIKFGPKVIRHVPDRFLSYFVHSN